MEVREGPGYRLEFGGDGWTLVVTGPWGDAAEAVVESGFVTGLDLNYARGFKDTDPEFLRSWRLSRLTLLARTVDDLGPVYRLASTLTSLSLTTSPRAHIDLAAFRQLDRVSADWPQVRASLGDARQITDVSVYSFDETDLTPFASNPRIARLRVRGSVLGSLNGAEHLSALENLEVDGAPLTDLEALGLAPLKRLSLEGCARISSLRQIERLKDLALLNASECGDIESLAPLSKLQQLETLWIYGTTRVLDGDLSPLAGLPNLKELRMKSRRSYEPSVAELQTGLGEPGLDL